MSALSLLRSRVSVGIDQLNPDLAERYGPFIDMTSDSTAVASLIAADTHIEVIRRVLARAKIETESTAEAVDLAMDMLVVLMSKAVLPHLTGRVHAHISPRHALSTSATLNHAHRLIHLFAQEGVSPGRVCLGIPATGAGMSAALELEGSGIRTNATLVFSTHQAQAARSVGCLYVSPVFNDFSAMFDNTWKAYPDPANEHPMSETIRDIVEICDHGPGVMVSGVISPAEALAVSTLGIEHITLGPKVIEGLACGVNEASFSGGSGLDHGKERGNEMGQVRVVEDPEEVGNGNGKANGEVQGEGERQSRAKGKRRSIEVDLLANQGQALDDLIKADQIASRKLDYSIRALGECEARISRVFAQLMSAG